ncbi:MAG TPA: diaminopimelate epimerase [Gemmatimonadales bacterium]|nr:diaminopimelate epimerase [Gemmatimonadales bacterium]
MLPAGRTFYKMSGSGNDFVMVDAMREPAGTLADPAVIQAVCARATGIGADGIVFLEPSSSADYRMTYLNSDGSRADLCGNASLCSARLATELGIVHTAEFRVQTDAGILGARLLQDGPEVDLQPVTDVRRTLPFRLEPGERWMGYAVAGVPHLTVRVDDAATVDVVARGRPLRHEASLPGGANVNFVSADDAGGWRIRTFERGVEGETLACGTGAVATAILLHEAGEAGERVALRTRSGRTLTVRLARAQGGWQPSLSGEARLVFAGRFGEL